MKIYGHTLYVPVEEYDTAHPAVQAMTETMCHEIIAHKTGTTPSSGRWEHHPTTAHRYDNGELVAIPEHWTYTAEVPVPDDWTEPVWTDPEEDQ